MIGYELVAGMNGWLEPQALTMLEQVNDVQKDLYGNIVEIGIHHGKFFLPLASCLKEGEYAFAVDLFENQEENISKSGLGSLTIFSTVLANILPTAKVCILKDNSLNLKNKSRFFNFNQKQVRIFSVDGGHEYHEVKNDLMLAALSCHREGVVIVDDFQHIGWTGVYNATIEFIHASRYVPIAIGGNKLFLCDDRFTDIYQAVTGISAEEHTETINNEQTRSKVQYILEKFPNTRLFPEQRY